MLLFDGLLWLRCPFLYSGLRTWFWRKMVRLLQWMEMWLVLFEHFRDVFWSLAMLIPARLRWYQRIAVTLPQIHWPSLTHAHSGLVLAVNVLMLMRFWWRCFQVGWNLKPTEHVASSNVELRKKLKLLQSHPRHLWRKDEKDHRSYNLSRV